MTIKTFTTSIAASAVMLVAAAAALQYSPVADARGYGNSGNSGYSGRGGHGGHGGHGGYRAGYFIGGAVFGAALIGSRYYYPPPVYYYPPAPIYYPPPVVYAAPPPAVVYSSPPPAPQYAPQQYSNNLPIDERLRQLRNLCDQALLSAQECQVRRNQILSEL